MHVASYSTSPAAASPAAVAVTVAVADTTWPEESVTVHFTVYVPAVANRMFVLD
jgi:hypothetical protein